MNYGKTAYLKVIDIEKRLANISNENGNYSSCIELSKRDVNETFSSSNSLTISFPKFDVYKDKNICFQIKVSLFLASSCSVSTKLNIDGLSIHEESKNLIKGDNELIIFKSFCPLSDSSIEPSLTFSLNSDSSIATINSVSMVVLGANSANSNDDEIEVGALATDSNHVILSFIDSDKLYYQRTTLEIKQLNKEDFTFYKDAISHCFVKASLEGEQENLFRVDKNHNLYLSTPFENSLETLIATNVTKVFASTCPKSGDDTNIVAYIKDDGECYYKTLREGTLTNEYKFNIPKGRYTDLKIVCHEDSDYVYVILSHENGSSYIIHSLIEVSTGRMVELLDTSALIKVTKYIDINFAKEKLNEHINLGISSEIVSKLYYNETIESLAKENLYLNSSLSSETYKVTPTYVYGVKIDVNKYKTPKEWTDYADDCVEFEPATLDYNNEIFYPNGWLERWPFNEIRPCIIKDGKVKGYLNKDDYTKYEDGSDANITSKENGDVMVEFPKIYYRISKQDRTIHLQISNKKLEGFSEEAFVYKGKILDKVYISAYICGNRNCTSVGFYSYSGNALNVSSFLSDVNCYNALRKFADRDNYEFISIHQYNMLAIMYTILFKSTKAHEYTCRLSHNSSESLKTGYADKKGMYFGSYFGASRTNKFFGLEGLFGYKPQILVGYSIDANKKIRVVDTYDENMTFDPKKVDTYKLVEEDYILPPSSAPVNILEINGSNYTSFFGIDGVDDRMNNHYGFEASNFYRSSNLPTTSIFFGTSPNIPDLSSIFSMMAVSGNEYNKSLNARLVYYPMNQGE